MTDSKRKWQWTRWLLVKMGAELDENDRIVALKTNSKLDTGESVCNTCGKIMPICWDTICSVCNHTFCYTCSYSHNGWWLCSEHAPAIVRPFRQKGKKDD